MYKTSILAFLLFCSIIKAQDDKKNKLFANAAEDAKMILAKQKLYGGSYLGALSMFRDLEKNNPDNTSIKYYIGLCYYSVGQNEKAKESLLKALEIGKDVKPETNLLLGKLYHKEANIEKATEQFEKSLALSKSSNKEEVTHLIAQCNIAKGLMSQALDVNITNLGNTINSKYDDKNPCITADGKKLVFTTRRPEGTNDVPDIEGDGKYFENVYIASIDSVSGNFKNAGGVNTINSKIRFGPIS